MSEEELIYMSDVPCPEFPKASNTSSGNTVAYSVEARMSDHAEPVTVGSQMFTNKWKTVEYSKGHPVGVPTGPQYSSGERDYFGLLGYPAAQALRWWLHAIFDAASHSQNMSLETRIVKHNVKFSYESTPVSSHELIHGSDRSNTMPDWGVKQSQSNEKTDDKT